MKKYLVIFILILGVLITGSLCLPKSVHTNYHTNDGQLVQVITADMKHERTISWKSESMDNLGYLELRSQNAKGITRVTAKVTTLPSYHEEDKQNYMYQAHVTDLTPDTVYEYRVSTGKWQSDWKHFKTEPESAVFKTLIFGDSQSGDYDVWAQTAKAAWKNNNDASFFINMGDLVDNGQDHSQWNGWINGAQDLLAQIPVAPVMGNHEAYSLEWKMAEPEYYLSLFDLPRSGPTGLDRYAYSYDYGDVHFVVINTQLQELGEWQPELFTKQKSWLERDLAATQKKWKVVLMHRGIWEYPFTGPLDAIGQTFVPIFDAYHVNLVFTAHVHSYARTVPLKNGIPNSSGTVYITTGRSGDKVWDKSPQKPTDEFFYNPLDMPNYLTLEAAHDYLKVTAFKQNGDVLDQTIIRQ